MSALALLLLLGASPANPIASIDHIILGAKDLDSAVRAFEQSTGVKPQFGGVHPGRGTRNALVSLGDGTYLEIIAPDPDQKDARGMGADLATLQRTMPVGWAIGTTDVAALRAQLDRRAFRSSEPEPGNRATPSGAHLSWVTFGVSGIDDNVAPFFIQWADPSQHPSHSAPAGCRLRSLSVKTPQPDSLAMLVGQLGLKVTITRNDRATIAVSLDCPKGRITFQ